MKNIKDRVLDTFLTDKGYQIERRTNNDRRKKKNRNFYFRYERRIAQRRISSHTKCCPIDINV